MRTSKNTINPRIIASTTTIMITNRNVSFAVVVVDTRRVTDVDVVVSILFVDSLLNVFVSEELDNNDVDEIFGAGCAMVPVAIIFVVVVTIDGTLPIGWVVDDWVFVVVG